jgi:hypothetical protein
MFVHCGPTPRRNIQSALFRYFDELFPGMVHSAVVHMNIKEIKLEETIDKTRELCERLDLLVLKRESMRRSRGSLLNRLSLPFGGAPKDDPDTLEVTEKIPRKICMRSKGAQASDAQDEAAGFVAGTTLLYKTVLAVPYYEQRLKELNDLMAEKQKALLTLSADIEATPSKKFLTKHYSSSGAVIFTTKTGATVAMQALLSNNQGHMEVVAAPDPRDIVWTNCTFDVEEAKKRRTVVTLAVKAVGAFLFIPALVFCNLFGNIDKLSKFPGLSFLSALEPGSFFYDFITGQVCVSLFFDFWQPQVLFQNTVFNSVTLSAGPAVTSVDSDRMAPRNIHDTCVES